MTMTTTADTDMEIKILAAVDQIVEQEGEFSALVAAFGNTDRAGDRIMAGAFAQSLADWRKSGQRIPILWSHQNDPAMIIGSADPALSHETDAGLVLTGRLNIERSAAAAQVRDLLQNDDISGWSFGYVVKRSRKAAGGVTELLQLDILEAGPCISPVNTAARTLSVKGEPMPNPDQPMSHAELERQLLERRIISRTLATADHPATDSAMAEAERLLMIGVLNTASNGHTDEHHYGKAVAAPSTYTDAQWQAACIIDYADGDTAWLNAPAKHRHAMPIRQPSGALDHDALARAAISLPQMPIDPNVKRAAAKRLIAAHDEAGIEVTHGWLLALTDGKAMAARTKSAAITVAQFGC